MGIEECGEELGADGSRARVGESGSATSMGWGWRSSDAELDSWIRVRLVRQVALCSGSHRLFYAEPVTQGGWKARQMTDADIQLPG